MRRFGICEERGSGVDKVVFETEFHQLPAPLFEVNGDFTRVTLFAHRPLTKMDRSEKARACYLHPCLRWVQGEELTNASLRTRFGLGDESSATASRIIKDAVDVGLIVLRDPATSRRLMVYLPYWAAGTPRGPHEGQRVFAGHLQDGLFAKT
jgi:ATP-dependent DNA helicase RecG